MKWFFGAIAGAVGLPIVSFGVVWMADWLYTSQGFVHPIWMSFESSASFVFLVVALFNVPLGGFLGAVTGLLLRIDDGVTVTAGRVCAEVAGCLVMSPLLLGLFSSHHDKGFLNAFPTLLAASLWALWLIQWGLRNHHSPLTTPPLTSHDA